MRVGLVVSEFNYSITSMMSQRTVDHAPLLGAEVVRELKVAGVFDMPLAVKHLLEQDDIDGVVTIGVVIRGETGHDEVVIAHTTRKMVDLALDFNKPVGLGITGPGMTRLQAENRIDNGMRALEAVVKLHRAIQGPESA